MSFKKHSILRKPVPVRRTELSSYEYYKVIEIMTEQIQTLMVERPSVLYDFLQYLPENKNEDEG